MNTQTTATNQTTGRNTSVTKGVQDAFRAAKLAQDIALEAVIDTLAAEKAAQQVREQTLAPMRSQLRTDLDPGVGNAERVRKITASGNTALVYRKDKSHFSKAKLETMISESRAKGDNRRAKTLCDVLTTCFTTEALATVALDINP